MDRILILTAADGWSDVSACLAGAHSCAGLNKRVSYGLILHKQPSASDLDEMHLLGSVQYLVSEADPFYCFSKLWQGESHTLLADRSVLFDAGWDITLLRMLRQLERNGTEHPVLTGIPPLFNASVDAFRAVAAERITGTDGTISYRPGTPVRYAREPQRTPFLSLQFCFASSSFFRTLECISESPSVAAFINGWDLFVPCRCPCHAQTVLCPPAEDIRDPAAENWRRYARKAGITDRFPYLTGQARTGILSADLAWETSIPLRQRILDRIRSVSTSGSPLSLLCVSAVLSEPVHPENTPEENTACLRWLTAVRELSMIFLADAVTRPNVQLNHPNVIEFAPAAGLPVYRRLPDIEDPDYLRMSRMFFLRYCKERNPGHSHYAWLDPCSVSYPVDPDTIPNLKPFCSDRITIAEVDGKPDFSMIIVPTELISPLCGEIAAFCDQSSRKPVPFPTEEEVWSDLIGRFPSRFTMVPLPEKYGLIAHILRVSANDTCFQ